jgi:UDP-3-O-[3-hydroxymyristoyl] N-acetylglucosamine deacetylase
LAGARLHARFIAHRCGHTLNNRLLHAVFAESAAWRLTLAEPVSRRDYGLAKAA